jgi:hypothetical protein
LQAQQQQRQQQEGEVNAGGRQQQQQQQDGGATAEQSPSVVVAATGQYASGTVGASRGPDTAQGTGLIAPQLVDGGPAYQVPLGGGLIAARVIPWAGAHDILAFLQQEQYASSAAETLPN